MAIPNKPKTTAEAPAIKQIITTLFETSSIPPPVSVAGEGPVCRTALGSFRALVTEPVEVF